jgi:polygalacturonase
MKPLTILAFILPCIVMARPYDVEPLPDSLYDVPFAVKKIATPHFPANVHSITEFGAVGDGQTDNSEAFEKAIRLIESQQGGILVVPRGIWLTGPITFCSNLNLHLEHGALLLFTPDKTRYPIQEIAFEGYNTRRCQSPITGKDLHNIAITGEGIIDGNGDVWRAVKKNKLSPPEWKRLVKSGGVVENDQWFPSQGYLDGLHLIKDQNVPEVNNDTVWEHIRDFLRPVMVSFIRCTDVTLDGVTFQNSPAWCLHPLMCTNLRVSNVTVRNPWYSQNGDGLDIESCSNSVVWNSSFDVGDDAICIKSGKDEDGRKRGIPTKGVIVKGCTVYHGHGGFVVGSEMSGGVEDIDVSECLFIGTDVGLRFKSTRGRGGVVKNIHIADVAMKDIQREAILFDLWYQQKGNIADSVKVAVDETTPEFRDITIRHIRCRGAKQGILLRGLPEKPVQNVRMQDILISSERGILLRNTKGVRIEDVRIRHQKGALIEQRNAEDLSIRNVESYQE